ncbi:hypothetical protein [Saccharibacillus deserti]|uniref:hypothetical protein n=1 Tax=Saccharibacillus deserti TaxID=1634444 RepID=UPI001552694B|nr:hypothetical protein [Saccharibacillus deserti]
MSNLSLSLLSIRKKRREGYPCTFEYGDFMIDGLRLYDRVLQQYSNLDDISCLGFGAEAFRRKQIEKLLLIGNVPHTDSAVFIGRHRQNELL